MAKPLEIPWDNVRSFDREKREFRKLDLEGWLRDNKIIELARKDGKHNQPAVDQALSGTPAKIIDWVNRRGSICKENVTNWLTDLSQNLADMADPQALKAEEQRVRQTLEDARLALDNKVQQHSNHTLQQDVSEARYDFEAFRRESKLRRLPDYSGRASAWKYIVGFFCLEVVLNATSLMAANPFGLLGAVVQMGLICMVNILIMGGVMGELLRWIRHVDQVKRRLAGLVSCIVVAFVFCFNLMVGHFRDSMEAIIDDPTADIFAVGRDTFARFAEGPVAFDSFQSALLALLGFLFFGVAAWKWLARDDHYPGYGNKHRLLQVTEQDYIARHQQASAELQSEFEAYKSRLKDIYHRLITQQTRWRETRIQGKPVVADFKTHMNLFNHDLDFLLKAYYSANLAERTQPAPAWFAETVKVDQDILVPPVFELPEQNSLEEVADGVDQAITDLQRFYDEKRQQFPTLTEVVAAVLQNMEPDTTPPGSTETENPNPVPQDVMPGASAQQEHG